MSSGAGLKVFFFDPVVQCPDREILKVVKEAMKAFPQQPSTPLMPFQVRTARFRRQV